MNSHWSSERDVHGFFFMVSNGEKLGNRMIRMCPKMPCQNKQGELFCLLCVPRCLSSELNAKYPLHHLYHFSSNISLLETNISSEKYG